MFTNNIQKTTRNTLRNLLAAALIAAPLVASATSPSPEWYLRENLLKAVSSNVDATNLVSSIAEQNGLKCDLNLNDVTDERSMSITYEPQTFTAHYHCSGGKDMIIDVKGTFTSDFLTVTGININGVSLKK